MSGERIIQSQDSQTEAVFEEKTKINKKVDINLLLKKLRAEEKKEKFGNLVWIGLVTISIFVTGIIVSL
tara:strand:- start:964 stop:1170 length:207 start_codon:yes stop_codon:yes gene_type:complete